MMERRWWAAFPGATTRAPGADGVTSEQWRRRTLRICTQISSLFLSPPLFCTRTLRINVSAGSKPSPSLAAAWRRRALSCAHRTLFITARRDVTVFARAQAARSLLSI